VAIVAKENYKLLRKWLLQTTVDNPEIIKDSESEVHVYVKLYEIWLVDCQKAFKELIKETM